jgi:chitin disaccharide deacetylase
MTGRRLVITGDDLGKTTDNNAGILAAHTQGILTTACLMMGGDAVAEAIDLAHRHPTLAVGLHIAFADVRPVLPPEQVPLLVQSDGRFPPDDRAHKSALWTITGCRQVQAEIAAQFRAYAATGLRWDHVNTHRHVHRHPILAAMLFREAAKWPVRVTRVPHDPPVDPARQLRFWALRWLATHYGLQAPDRSIGRDWTAATLATLVPLLPTTGVTELYFHPGDPLFAGDLAVLTDDQVKAAVRDCELLHGLDAGRTAPFSSGWRHQPAR